MAHQTDVAPLRENSATYGIVSLANHWIIAAAMIGLLLSGLLMACGPLTRESVAPIRNWHKAIDVIVLVCGLCRIGWRVAQGFPTPPSVMTRWPESASRLAH